MHKQIVIVSRNQQKFNKFKAIIIEMVFKRLEYSRKIPK